MKTLILQALRAPVSGSRALRYALLVLVSGLVLTALACWRSDIARQKKVQELCDERGQAFVSRVRDRMRTYEYGIRGLRGAVIGAGLDRLNHKTIDDYMRSRELQREFPGARGFGFVRRVPAAEVQRYVLKAATDHHDGLFQLHELSPNTGERWVIEFVEPEALNQKAIGLDIASETNRREAAYAAMSSGQPRLSAPVTLVQASNQPQRGFLLLIPIYADGLPISSEEERIAAARGWGYAPLLIDEVLEGIGTGLDGIDVSLTDARADVEDPLFFTSGAAKPVLGLPHSHYSLELYGRDWTIDVFARPELAQETGLIADRWLLAAGSLLSLLLALLTYFWRLPADRREQLQLEQFALSSGVIDGSSQAIVVADEQGRIVQANRRVLDIFGHGSESLLGQPVEMLLPIAHRMRHQALRAGYDNTSRQMGARQDLWALHAKGHEFPVEVNLSPLSLAGRKLVVAAVVDVTEQRAAVALLKASETRWRELADSMPQLVWTCDAEGRCDFLSAQWVAYTGIPESEQLGFRWLEQLHPEDRTHSGQIWTDAVAALANYDVEYRIRRHDGVYRWFDTRGVPLFDSSGKLERWIGSCTDIEARKQAEGELRQLNANLENLVAERSRDIAGLSERLSIATRSAGMGVWDWNIVTNVLIWDEQMYRLYFFDPSAQSGREPYTVWSGSIHPEDRARTEAQLMAAVAGEQEYLTDFRVLGPQGQQRHINAAGLVVRDEQGKAIRMVGVNRDVTALHLAEEAMSEARRQAEKANQAKSAFLANMSHEIRTPMNAVMNLCYLLEQTALDQEQQELSSKMRIASRSLLGLINDILDLSKIEAGEMGLVNEAMSPRLVIDDVVKLMQVNARGKRLDLRVSMPPELPSYVRGDSLRLTQVLTNLLSNAIKFTDRGHVSLSVTANLTTAGRVGLHFDIEDSGIGISPDIQPLLFNAFAQGDASTTRRFGGTGLGLAIVKRLVGLMGGNLGMESAPGIGSRFWFDLDLVIDEQGTLAANAPQALDTLVVDDNPQQRETVRDSCRALGWRVEAVASGQEAVERVSDRLKSGRPFDAIIVDWLMPEMDGLETIQRLNGLHGRALPAAILLVTASDHQSLRKMPGAELADAVLGLPTDASTLFNVVHQAVARNNGSVSRVTSTTTLAPRGVGKRLTGVRLLLVDDSSVNLDVGQRILEKEGATVLLAVHGAQALDLAREERDALDIVLMDVQMPVMDGIEACRRIRAELGRRLPIIAVTAGALVSERERAIEAGMNDFVTKPFDAETLIQRIRQHVESARGELLPLGPTSTAVTVVNTPRINGLDLSTALARIGGDQRLLKSLLRRLLDEFADFGAALPTVSGADSRLAAAQRAHKLRGIAGNVGAERVQRLAGELEACARDPQCQQLHTLLNSIAVAIEDLRAASAEWLSSDDPLAATTKASTDDAGLAEAIDELCEQLRQNNLTALDTVEPLAANLEQRLGQIGFGQFRAALDALRFAEALALLKAT